MFMIVRRTVERVGTCGDVDAIDGDAERCSLLHNVSVLDLLANVCDDKGRHRIAEVPSEHLSNSGRLA